MSVFNVTADEIRAWPEVDGWHVAPNGTWIKLGNDCKLGNYCTLGDDCKLGNYCTLGDDCKLGNYCTLGDDCKLGNYCTLGDYCKLGDDCKLGNYCTLGDGCTLDITPLYIIGTRHYMTWVGGDLIQSGCITQPVVWWLERVERCAKEHGYTEREQREYRMHVEHVVEWMRLYELLPDESAVKTESQ